MTKKQLKENKRQEAISYLRKILTDMPEKRIYTKITHVSSSGMTRWVSCYISENGKIININYYVNRILDYGVAKDGGVKVGGCGFDAGFEVVYGISYHLYNDGYVIKHSSL